MPYLLQKNNRTRNDHRDVTFEVKAVLAEVISNETEILAVEERSLITPTSMLYKMSLLYKLGKAYLLTWKHLILNSVCVQNLGHRSDRHGGIWLELKLIGGLRFMFSSQSQEYFVQLNWLAMGLRAFNQCVG